MSENPKLIKNGGDGTFVGNALRFLVSQGKVISPIILDAAGKVSGVKGLSDLADAISGDKELPSKDKDMLIQQINFDLSIEQELTKRLEMDNEHGVTRLVRPVTYGTMFLLFLVVVILDGNAGLFTVRDSYIPVIESLFSTMTVFYFGSRGFEKMVKTWKK